MSYLFEYWDLIRRKEVIVGYWIRKVVKNLIEDIDDPRYIYDTTTAHKRIKFMETLCLQSKAPYYMKPLKLMPWQKAFIEALYSFKMADTGKRRFTRALLEIARKNGKSTLLAGDGNCELFVGRGGSDVCCASLDDATAKLIWKEIAGMRERLDPKRTITTQTLTELRNFKRNITVSRMSAKTRMKDGRNLGLIFLDEIHDVNEPNGGSEIAEALWRSTSSQDEPLMIECTTQGFNRNCYLDEQIKKAKAIINGEIDNEHYLAFLYEQDSEQEIWQDEASWEKSNPSLRYGVKKIEKLREDVNEAKYVKATRIHLLTKDFNLPQSGSQTWLALEDYDYPQAPVDLEDFRGSVILGAVDLSATTDLTSAKALIMRPGDRTKYVLQHYWIPESKLEAADDKDAGAKYAEWARDGRLTICEGNEVDVTLAADWFYQLYKDFKLRPLVIGYDQRFAKTFVERCEDYGFETEMIHQGRALSLAMKLVEADFKSRVINYGGDPMDKWNFGNCCCKVDNVGDIQPVKVPGMPGKRIDGAVTLIILYETLRRYRGECMTAIGGG